MRRIARMKPESAGRKAQAPCCGTLKALRADEQLAYGCDNLSGRKRCRPSGPEGSHKKVSEQTIGNKEYSCMNKRLSAADRPGGKPSPGGFSGTRGGTFSGKSRTEIRR